MVKGHYVCMQIVILSKSLCTDILIIDYRHVIMTQSHAHNIMYTGNNNITIIIIIRGMVGGDGLPMVSRVSL